MKFKENPAETEEIVRMVVQKAEISENKEKRKVSFRLTVDVYYPDSEYYPLSPENYNATETTG